MPVFAASSIAPAAVLAGDSTTIVVRLEVGSDYSRGPTRLVFDLPGQVGMSRPTRIHQELPGFTVVRLSNPAVAYRGRVFDIESENFVGPRGEGTSHRAMAARLFVLDLEAGLTTGDVIELRWGDTCWGYGAGTKITQVVPRTDFACAVQVRYFTDHERGVPDHGRDYHGYQRPRPEAALELAFRVSPRDPVELRLLRRSRDALLLPLDRFGNVAELAALDEVANADRPLDRNDQHAWSCADPAVQVTPKSLPLRQGPDMRHVYGDLHLFWGDIHTHSAISNDCIERERLDQGPSDLLRYARQQAALDFCAITDHHEPYHEVKGVKNGLTRHQWEETAAAVREHNRPGDFLAMAGFEYRCPRGDTVFDFAEPPPFERIDREDWTDVRAVWADLADLDCLSSAHFHNGGRLAENEWWACPAPTVEPAVEIFSCHGSYERPDVREREPPLIKNRRPDRTGLWLLHQGLRYGLIANSDGHKGHVGTNGLTAVFAAEPTAAAIFAAYRARRVYATTNARIRLVFTANGGLMGSVLPDAPRQDFHIAVVGEAPLKMVELFRDGVLHRRWPGNGLELAVDESVDDAGPGFWHVRVTQLDDHLAWSSPIWFE